MNSWAGDGDRQGWTRDQGRQPLEPDWSAMEDRWWSWPNDWNVVHLDGDGLNNQIANLELRRFEEDPEGMDYAVREADGWIITMHDEIVALAIVENGPGFATEIRRAAEELVELRQRAS